MKLTESGYYCNRHSCFLLQYHFVVVTKYRKPAIRGNLKHFLYEYTIDFFEHHGCVVQEINGESDHIHILFDATPQINLAKMINAYKSASSRNVRKLFQEELSQYYWKPYFWCLSYFIACVSERSAEIVRQYIHNQKG